jgi:NAD(P)-dependent dehydrogenase (short-subunit alcohol dehydrogenase family)
MNAAQKTILVCGAAGGLGRAVTPILSRTGAQLVLLGREAPRDAESSGQQWVPVDVTQEGSVRQAVERVLERAGRIDGLVNLVGGFASGRLMDTPFDQWERMLALNLTSAYLLSRAVMPAMVAQRSGRIIHIAAKAALEPFPGAAAYVASKAGLVALVRAVALETKGSGLTINAILPSTIDTPANRASMPDADPSQWVRPASIAETLLFLLSDEAQQITGAAIPVG